MGQITEDFILRAMRQCQLGRHPPMTVWEVRQLLTAWVEWQACREDAERWRFIREHRPKGMTLMPGDELEKLIDKGRTVLPTGTRHE